MRSRTGYLSAVYERERIAVLDRVSESLRESRRLTDARVREGDAAPLEAQLLAVEQSRADAQRADATGRLIAAEMEFRRLIGLAPTDALPAIGPPTGGEAALPLEQWISRAKEKRADLRTARLLEQQGEAETALAKAEARPDVTFSARYTHNNTRLDNQYGFTSAGALTPASGAIQHFERRGIGAAHDAAAQSRRHRSRCSWRSERAPATRIPGIIHSA